MKNLQQKIRRFVVSDGFWRKLSRRRLTIPEEILSNSLQFMFEKLMILYPLTGIEPIKPQKIKGK